MCIVYDGYFPNGSGVRETEEWWREIYEGYMDMFLEGGWRERTNKYRLKAILDKKHAQAECLATP
jgi:fructosamine-3-kinase